MNAFEHLTSVLNQERVAREVALPHDEARRRYTLRKNTVSNGREFERAIADYYAYHYTTCISRGGKISPEDALAEARRLIQSAYRRKNLSFNNAYADARSGINGGLAGVLDVIADALRDRTMANYVEAKMDETVAFDSWAEQVNFMREFLGSNRHLPPDLREAPPEQFAKNWKEVMSEYLESVNRINTRLRGV